MKKILSYNNKSASIAMTRLFKYDNNEILFKYEFVVMISENRNKKRKTEPNNCYFEVLRDLFIHMTNDYIIIFTF